MRQRIFLPVSFAPVTFARVSFARVAFAPVAFLVVLACLPTALAAHKPSDSYLDLVWHHDRLDGQWDIALRDLEYAIGLDADGDGAITWGELRTRQDAIAGYALSRLDVYADDAACPAEVTQLAVDRHSDGAYAVLGLDFSCRAPERALTVSYDLFFDLDPTHRGLIQVRNPQAADTAVLAPDRSRRTFSRAGLSVPAVLADYWREGIWHIWIGFDHLLFLLTLLLPAALCWRRDGGWQAAPSVRHVLGDVLGIVTAFTVAHSITLAIAVLGWIALPSRLVESAIAATVALAALHNLRPVIARRGWLIAFALGLIHGFGFAGVLADLGLPTAALAWALIGFNAGVECGQLAIVAAFLPLALAGRTTSIYRGPMLRLVSAATAVLAAVWLVERSLDIRLLPM